MILGSAHYINALAKCYTLTQDFTQLRSLADRVHTRLDRVSSVEMTRHLQELMLQEQDLPIQNSHGRRWLMDSANQEIWNILGSDAQNSLSCAPGDICQSQVVCSKANCWSYFDPSLSTAPISQKCLRVFDTRCVFSSSVAAMEYHSSCLSGDSGDLKPVQGLVVPGHPGGAWITHPSSVMCTDSTDPSNVSNSIAYVGVVGRVFIKFFLQINYMDRKQTEIIVKGQPSVTTKAHNLPLDWCIYRYHRLTTWGL